MSSRHPPFFFIQNQLSIRIEKLHYYTFDLD
nr:MAG TPA: hypothetical protein [Caudoviricetes sp.]